MMVIVGQVRRKGLTLDAFADITGPDVHIVPPIRPDGIEFDGDLTVEQRDAVRERMASRDDADQARRAALRTAFEAVVDADEPETLEDALATIALLRTAIASGLNYMLGE